VTTRHRRQKPTRASYADWNTEPQLGAASWTLILRGQRCRLEHHRAEDHHLIINCLVEQFK
jgi:hypothetical protein